jgi:methionine sulfoxide reductase catalytic subunit
MWRDGIKPSEITPERVFLDRRRLIAGAIAMGVLPATFRGASGATIPIDGEYAGLTRWPGSTDEKQSPWAAATTYNNYYEFGQGKGDPARRAHSLVTDPWSIEVTGEAGRLGTYTLEDILKPHALEERIYRLRCVEHWSMVIPWVGFPMGDLLRRFEPGSSARYVRFFTLADREQMPGLKSRVLDWPYTEGLTIEEAMHPLTLAAVGAYGKVLPNQNGAPIRLVVPWKYGYKSIKSIVRIHFTAESPRLANEPPGKWSWTTSWNEAWPKAYGFYSNVNPDHAHPRWTQEIEQRLDGRLFSSNIPTRMFNGYAEEVANLYKGMDLRRNY